MSLSLKSPSDLIVKPSFHMSIGKISEGRGFHCFQTVPDFAKISIGKFEVFIGNRRHFYLSREMGNLSEAIRRIGNVLKLLQTFLTVLI